MGVGLLFKGFVRLYKTIYICFTWLLLFTIYKQRLFAFLRSLGALKELLAQLVRASLSGICRAERSMFYHLVSRIVLSHHYFAN